MLFSIKEIKILNSKEWIQLGQIEQGSKQDKCFELEVKNLNTEYNVGDIIYYINNINDLNPIIKVGMISEICSHGITVNCIIQVPQKY